MEQPQTIQISEWVGEPIEAGWFMISNGDKGFTVCLTIMDLCLICFTSRILFNIKFGEVSTY